VIQTPEEEERDVALAVGGDARAFERLYRRHHGRVFSLALRMVGPVWAEDLTQEVFVRAWVKLVSFQGRSAFGTWLHRLAVNLILSKHQTLKKREEQHRSDPEVLSRLSSRGHDPGLGLDFDTAIQQLPEGARQVFVLFDVEGYPHAEIAEMMGISPGTSKSQLHRARMMLREHLR
jgi:RNA polymerase sigma-70 factor (ECF subfamily)